MRWIERVLAAPVAVLLVIAVSGCGLTEPDLFSLWVRVEGTVTSDEGAVPDAEVTLRMMSGGGSSCGRYVLDDAERVVTDEAGSYSGTLQGLSIGPIPGCVEVHVAPPVGTFLQARTDTIRSLLVSGERDSAPPNRLNVMLDGGDLGGQDVLIVYLRPEEGRALQKLSGIRWRKF